MAFEIGYIFAVVITVSIFSLAVKENIVVSVVEHLAIAIGGAYVGVLTIRFLLDSWWKPMISGPDYTLLVPLVLGILMYGNLSRDYRWVARYPTSLIVGTFLGLGIRATIGTQIIKQIAATAKPLATGDMLTNFNNLVMIICVISTMLYFVFVIEEKGAFKQVKTFGRLILMFAFGATFGNQIMGIFTRLIDRVLTLLGIL